MSTRISVLSSIIAEKTKVVDDYFIRNGIPTPSFDIDGPSRIQIPSHEQEASSALNDVLDASKELNLLLTGPASVIINTSIILDQIGVVSAIYEVLSKPMDCVSLHAIYHFKVAQALPIHETMSFEDLSSNVGLNVIDLRRLLRHAMCNGIFCEPKPGYIAHTATSRLLAEDKVMFDFAGIVTEESLAPAAKVVDALVKYNGAHAPEQTGYSLAQNTDMGLYDHMQDNYETRGKRWAGAMNAFAASLSLQPLLQGFDWAGAHEATMVDVGGGWGPVSIGVAEHFPQLQFIVQDLRGVVEEGSLKLPEKLRDRFQFMPYDFVREEQPVHGAAIYFFRAVFPNWPDEYCVKILRNQIPALNESSRLIIYDSPIPEPGTLPATVEKQKRDMDLKMLMWFGSRERNLADWKQILKEADPRFQLVTSPSTPAILVVEWKG